MRRAVVLLLALFLCAALTGCEKTDEPMPASSSEEAHAPDASGANYPQLQGPAEGAPVATVSTALGDISFILFPDDAPMAVENFTGLSEKGYYNGLPFHRVEPGFLLQTGASQSESGDETVWGGGAFPIEISAKLHHFTGAVAMAADENGGNKSQFYFVTTPDDSVTEKASDALIEAGMEADAARTYFIMGGAPALDGADTVFGQVYEGFDVLAAIEQSDEPVTVDSVTVGVFSAA